ncbi:hypothetical protein AciM339_1227 [Aciduliprofundum sp. MAR08-339]|nr:hypothetical protein AciM339_1227 [Aciduliprofundum sp. MAR08-339]
MRDEVWRYVKEGYMLRESPKWYGGYGYFYFIYPGEKTDRKNLRIKITKKALEDLERDIKAEIKKRHGRIYYIEPDRRGGRYELRLTLKKVMRRVDEKTFEKLFQLGGRGVNLDVLIYDLGLSTLFLLLPRVNLNEEDILDSEKVVNAVMKQLLTLIEETQKN